MAIFRKEYTSQEILGVVLFLALACFFGWQAITFSSQPEMVKRVFVEIDEAMALVALGFGLFSWSRMRAQSREVRRRIAAEERSRSLAMEDPLTGLPNRRQFEEALRAAVASPPSGGASHAVFMLDMNGFKKVNDVHGHPVGDEVLVEVGARLSQGIRDGDLLARLGGDEFAVLATHLVGPEAATSIARRMIDVLVEPVMGGNVQHTVGAAIGIALIPQDGDAEQVVRKADIALYRAKQESVSALRFFEHEMDAHVRERDELERELRAAIAADEIRPFYQPQIDLRSGAVVGFEALARWEHPRLGSISPSRFIPVADDCGLIGPLTDQLLRHACAEAARWPSHVTLSFNISPTQLRDTTLGLRIFTTLAETGLLPQRLEIELTESALVRDLEHARAVLGAIRETGVRIALDDFGTGYSSLYHLRAFKLDRIKIDRSFIDTMATDPDSAAIVRALIGLGTGLNLDVTAEGVETAEQEDALTAQGCAKAQGYRFGEALSAETAMALVSRAPAEQHA